MEPKDEGPSGANFHLFSRIESNDISGVLKDVQKTLSHMWNRETKNEVPVAAGQTYMY